MDEFITPICPKTLQFSDIPAPRQERRHRRRSDSIHTSSPSPPSRPVGRPAHRRTCTRVHPSASLRVAAASVPYNPPSVLTTLISTTLPYLYRDIMCLALCQFCASFVDTIQVRTKRMLRKKNSFSNTSAQPNPAYSIYVNTWPMFSPRQAENVHLGADTHTQHTQHTTHTPTHAQDALSRRLTISRRH